MPWQGMGRSSDAGEAISLQWTCHPHGVIVIEADGVIDGASAPRLAELIRNRLDTTVRSLVLDLSRVSFFDTAGAEILTETAHRGWLCGTQLVLVTGNRVVDTPLRVLDLDKRFTYADTIATAMTR